MIATTRSDNSTEPSDADLLPTSNDQREIWKLQCQLAETGHALAQVRAELDQVLQSRSWRVTRLLRAGLDGLRKLRRKQRVDRAPPRLHSVDEFALACAPHDRPLLLVDVTELAVENLQGGIQHTVKGILSEWLLAPPRGWQVVPVQLTREGIYVSASSNLRHLFGAFEDPHAGRRIDPRAGDVFLGLDLLRDHAVIFRSAMKHLRSLGVHVEVVVYDLLPIDLPHCVPQHIHQSFVEWLSAVGDTADGVVCISQTVGQRFGAWLSSGEGRNAGISIKSFHLGVPDLHVPQGARSGSGAPGLSYLMVGTVEPRKGYEDALDAFERIWSSDQGQHDTLTIVGRYGWGMPQFLQRLENHPELGRRLRWLRRATDEDVQACYASADALLFCSRGEGFGLPIVEAAQHGLPLILRDLPEFREVAGDGAFFFDAPSGAELQVALTRWRELKRKNEAPAPRAHIAITWRESASQLLAAVESAAKT